MKTSRKLLILCLVAVMAMTAVIPSTFSWYAHDRQVRYQGNVIKLVNSSNLADDANETAINAAPNYTVPISPQQSNSIDINTWKATKNNLKDGNTISSFSIAANKTQRYITTIKNNNSKAVSLDLEASNLTNSTAVSIGVCSPVVNEKNYASRPVKNKTTWPTSRIYFEPRPNQEQNDKISFWKADDPPPVTYDFTNHSMSPITDMNVHYELGSESGNKGLTKAANQDHNTYDNKDYDVYYGDIPTSAKNMFFFNHYYVIEQGTEFQNRTQAEDPASGYVYYLDNGTNSDNNKTFAKYNSFRDTLANVRNYYDKVTMSSGRTADISLEAGTKEIIDAKGKYDYTGKGSVTYSSSNTSVAKVDQGGLITAVHYGTATITTTIKGEFGDSINVPTEVTVQQKIPQAPIVQNLKIEANKEVTVVWYIKNDTNEAATLDNIFYTI